MSTREPRGSRRRPDAVAPEVKRLSPRSGLSRAEVIADQRQRIFAGMAAALSYHGYEDTKIADVIELAGLSRATFYEHFGGKEACFAAAYEDGVERLEKVIDKAAREKDDWRDRVAVGLQAGLDFLAADPALANLLLVESLAAAHSARLEHERSMVRLAEALRPPADVLGEEIVPEETLRLLAGGLASHLSGRVLAGEVKRLTQDHDLLLEFLLAPSQAADARVASG